MSEQKPNTQFSTGAERSSDANHLDFTSLPLIGLIGVAKTAAEGAAKYGRYNYMRGMPVHDLLNHSLRHIVLFLLGDRGEPHLEHAAWGLLAAVQSSVLDPSLSQANLLGPGAWLTKENQRELGRHERREIDPWSIKEVPEIQAVLAQRFEGFPQEVDEDRPIPASVVKYACNCAELSETTGRKLACSECHNKTKAVRTHQGYACHVNQGHMGGAPPLP